MKRQQCRQLFFWMQCCKINWWAAIWAYLSIESFSAISWWSLPVLTDCSSISSIRETTQLMSWPLYKKSTKSRKTRTSSHWIYWSILGSMLRKDSEIGRVQQPEFVISKEDFRDDEEGPLKSFKGLWGRLCYKRKLLCLFQDSYHHLDVPLPCLDGLPQ